MLKQDWDRRYGAGIISGTVTPAKTKEMRLASGQISSLGPTTKRRQNHHQFYLQQKPAPNRNIVLPCKNLRTKSFRYKTAYVPQRRRTMTTMPSSQRNNVTVSIRPTVPTAQGMAACHTTDKSFMDFQLKPRNIEGKWWTVSWSRGKRGKFFVESRSSGEETYWKRYCTRTFRFG
ncbi:hypothetical protein B0O99DRAFT_202898 [Bisporella sp. PMI_857]|nr:hypothetical protein B0O99DRAFT_202898 [Bisporella sp. PMI_857]